MRDSGRHAAEAEFWNRVYRDVDPAGVDVPAAGADFHSLYSAHGGCLRSERFFASLVRDLRQRDVVCIGGGVDRLALYLASAGNRVVAVDLSEVAAGHTRALAERHGLAARLTCRVAAWEDVRFSAEFDVAVVHHALHHMRFAPALANLHAALRPGGVVVAMEPVCLLEIVRRIHQRMPFHPLPFIAGERELGSEDLAAVRATFERTSLRFFDALSRESIAYPLHRAGLAPVLRALSSLDAVAQRICPPLRYLASYVVLRAWK